MADNAGNQMQGGGQNNLQPPQNQAYRQAIEQLRVRLGNQNTNDPNQQQQILNILRSNPQLMSAFIEHRQQMRLETRLENDQRLFSLAFKQKELKQHRLFSQSLSEDNCVRQQGISLMNQTQDQLADSHCQKKPRIDKHT